LESDNDNDKHPSKRETKMTIVINSECGRMQIEARSVKAAKAIYAAKENFDFDGAKKGKYPGSFFRIWKDGPLVESIGECE
jgi:hypothetical protein